MRAILERRPWLLAVAAGVVTFALFAPSIPSEFVNWDDHIHITQTEQIREINGGNIAWALTSFQEKGESRPYQPIAYLTYMVDHAVWGLNAPGYKLTNVALHALASGLLFLLILAVLRRFYPDAGMWLLAAALIATLFHAIHPLRVENVAWASQRRDVLVAVFFVLTLLGYLKYADTGKRGWYWASVGAATLAVFSKATAIPLPFVLLIMDWFPLKRLSAKAVLEKIPFVALSVLAAITAMINQVNTGSLVGTEAISTMSRVAGSIYAIMFYIRTTVMPIGLTALYPYDSAATLFRFEYAVFFLAFAAVTAVAVLLAVKRKWYAGLAAWLVYGALISITLPLAQTGTRIAADRYTYLAVIPFAILVGAAVLHYRTHKATPAVAAIGLVILAILTPLQCRVWKDSVSLWSHTVRHAPSEQALVNLGLAYLKRGQPLDALKSFDRAVELNETFPALWQRGRLVAMMGRPDAALPDLDLALRIRPEHPDALDDRGVVRAQLGDLDGAISDFRAALDNMPEDAELRPVVQARLERALAAKEP